MTDETAPAPGAEDPETGAVETPTLASEPLAWSQTGPDGVMTFGQSWRRAAVTAMVILSVAGAVAAAVVVLWPHHHQAAPASAVPAQAAPRPSAAPPPPAPAPPQTVTVQVPAPAPEPTPIVLTDTDRQFIAALRKAGIEYRYSDPGYPISMAHAVCDYESTHQQPAPGVDKSAQGGKWVEQNTIWYGINAVGFSSLAQQTYCPQFLDGEY